MGHVSSRKESEQHLRSSEAWFRALIQQSNDLIVVFDQAGAILYANPALDHMLGYSTSAPSDALRMERIHPEDQGTMIRMWISLSEMPGQSLHATYRVQRSNDEWMWLEGTLTNLLHDPAVGGVVLNARDITERKQLEAQLHELALHDPLTQLPNRTLLVDRMDQAFQLTAQQPDHGRIAVLHIDVNNFTSIRDGLGHAMSDVVLQIIAQRLQACLQVPQTLARFGGDEFVALLPGVMSESDIQEVVDWIRVTMAQPVQVAGQTITVGVSIGISVQRSRITGVDVLLREASDALHEAKRTGRERTVFYAEGMTEAAQRRYTLRSDLRQAVTQKEFSLRYQPIVDLDSGLVVQYEALLRWEHHLYGFISPAEFIPYAEADGTIVEIGQWGIRQVCRQLASAESSALVIAMNLSAGELGAPEIVDTIKAECASVGLAPSRLAIEVTEHTLIGDFPAAKKAIVELRKLGVAVAIDDFGTGFSSLQYLRELPVTAVKLDRTFVEQLDECPASLAIVKAIIDMAHAIGLTVTAEGIESASQLASLRRLGCDHGQGYFLAQPGMAHEMTERVASRPVASMLSGDDPQFSGNGNGSAMSDC